MTRVSGGTDVVRPRSAARPRVWTHAAALPLLLALVLLVAPVLAQTLPAFPALTGRVVDGANLLQPDQARALGDKLKAQEDRTSDQVVVATVPSLGGLEVEDYANRLFRAWKLGEAKRKNGVLLLVAPAERKVRIEVGYGLEGALTDAVTGLVIRTAIAPRFKAGDYAGGLSAGTDAILAVLSGDAEEWQRRAAPKTGMQDGIDPIVLFVIAIVVILIVSRLMGGRGGGRAYRRRGGAWIIPTSGGFGGGFGSGGGFGGGGGLGGGGGGFSGGGGSSGGGGASGGW